MKKPATTGGLKLQALRMLVEVILGFEELLVIFHITIELRNTLELFHQLDRDAHIVSREGPNGQRTRRKPPVIPSPHPFEFISSCITKIITDKPHESEGNFAIRGFYPCQRVL